ncbi:hypothetical protein PUMCH_004831 [Australozyma saopauloensis]|uniref:Bacterial surface antigen (D15) domain-containing protein n=1 Tax=Australozyma saopauloensis TaxID=291208 RepID=A0AAX4HG36_9ASCO|nr:hypothetical protein PUMCH_004831 [[Candida] saopauloensis]
MSSTGNLQTEILKHNALNHAESQPVYVTKVEVNGGSNFSRQFFQKLLAPVVEHSDYTLAQLLAHVNECRANLDKTHAFLKVVPSLHIDYTHPTPTAKSYNLDRSLLTKVVFDLDADEQKVGEVSLGFNTEENLAVNLGYTNNNFNRNAELVQIGVNYRPYKPSEHLILKIRMESGLRDPSFAFVTELYNTHENNQVWHHNSAKSLGGLIGINYTSTKNAFSVFNGYALSRRCLYDFDQLEVSAAVKRFGGDYLKSSIVSRLSFSNVDSLKSALPSSGSSIEVSNEIVSEQNQLKLEELPAIWIKTSAACNVFKSFYNGTYTSHFFGEAGNISSADKSRVHVSDLFYLGGFGSFPGFSRNSVQVNGGTQFYKVGATLYSRLPFAKRLDNDINPLRCFVTGMVGNVSDNITKDSGVISTGVGLRYFNKWVKLDAGYYLALRLNSEHDIGVRDGFQFEISIGGANQKE